MTGWWQQVREDPAHAAEIAVRSAQPLLAPHVAMWWSKTGSRSAEPSERTARRVVRRSIGVARRGGLITGSSFYVGMVPALVMIYCEQVVLVLRIAAAFGRDPGDPLRAAEFLYLQGRHPTVRAAAVALQEAGASGRRATPAGLTRRLARAVGSAPSLIGLRITRFRARSIVDKTIGAAQVASYFVPVVSLPVWAVSNALATRRLGRAALAFYAEPAGDLEPMPALTSPPRPALRTRRMVIGTVVPLALAMGVLCSLLPFSGHQHGLRWVTLAIGETVLALTFARLIRLTRTVGQPA